MAKLSFASYNMHRFNQGIPLLKSICDKNDLNVDCIFVREHWLTLSNLQRFDLSLICKCFMANPPWRTLYLLEY